jgi:hypothetical protein
MMASFIRRGFATMAALLVGAGLTAGAWAQNFFYREVAKDGRIYVFAIAKMADAFEKSGEMGVSITKLGYGPNGETMVFDSEDAIGLYNLKHDRPGDVSAVAKPVVAPKSVLSYKDGQTTAEFDKGSVTFTNRLQLRFTEQLPDDAVQLPGTGAKGDPKGSFRIRRYEPQFSGWIYTKNLTYKLEFAFQDLQAGANSGAINDAFFNYDFTKGKKQFRVQFGQFKVPFGRQELTSSFNQTFVDRSIASGEFERGRDQGVQIDGLLLGNKIEYRAGLFNGRAGTTARNQSLNDNDKFQYDVRLMWQPFGDTKYSESDFESTDKPLFSLAGAYESHDLGNTVAQPAATVPPAPPATPLPRISACPCAAGNFKYAMWGTDAVFKFKGFSLMGEYFIRKVEPSESATPGTPTFNSDGYHVQASFLFNKKRTWEAAFRYGSFDPTDNISSNDRTELGVGLNWFYNKHFAKVQADWRQLENKAAKTKDQEVRIQTQLYF